MIEQQLPFGQTYVPNDVHLDEDETQIMVITGPNMSGKSALLRQTALIVLLAQIGSFVPAEAAHLGLTDGIFTRVGASDNISRGESTFMVEMQEASSILNALTPRSLVLFDEPLSSLDAPLRKKLASDIRKSQKKEGFTGIFVTHDIAEAKAVADTVIVMENGKKKWEGAPEDFNESMLG